MEHSCISSTYTTFYHLVRELETFVDTSELKIAYDSETNAYLVGNGFLVQIEADFALQRIVKEAMREIISKHCSRIHPQG